MYPLSGYTIRLFEDTEFTYYDGDPGFTRSNTGNYGKYDYNVFDLNIHDYEFNGSMTVALYLDGKRINSDDYLLAAFDGSACVGHTEGLLFPLDGNMIFPLMVYGNEDNIPLTFKAYQLSTHTYYDIDKRDMFVSDMHKGDGFKPVPMEIDEYAQEDEPVSQAYPNPFNPSVGVDINLTQESYVSAKVYNIAGQEVATIYDGLLAQQTSKLTWLATDYASGVYFISIIIGDQPAINRKIVLLK